MIQCQLCCKVERFGDGEKWVSFECKHRLCSACSPVMDDSKRTVCPTCSPNPNNALNIERLYSGHINLPKSEMKSPNKEIIITKSPSSTSSSSVSKFVDQSSEELLLQAAVGGGGCDRSSCCSAGSRSCDDTSSGPGSQPMRGGLTADCTTFPLDRIIPKERSPRGSKTTLHTDDGWTLRDCNGAAAIPSLHLQEISREVPIERRRLQMEDWNRCLVEHSKVFRETVHDIGEGEADYKRKIAEAKDEVRSQAQERKKLIERTEKAMIMRLDEAMAKQMRESAVVQHDIEMNLVEMESLTEKIRDSSSSSAAAVADDNLMSLDSFDEISKDLKRLLMTRVGSIRFGTVTFCPENLDVDHSVNVLGELDFLPLNDHDHSMFFRSPMLINSLPSIDDRPINGLTVVQGEFFLIRDGLCYIEVYDVYDLRPLRHLSLLHLYPKMLVPTATELASCPTTESLYLADTANQCIYRLKATDGQLVTHWKVSKDILGLSVTSNGNVLVGLNGQIREFDGNGKPLRTITVRQKGFVKKKTVQPTMVQPRHFVRLDDNRLIVCDWSAAQPSSFHAVYEIDEQGSLGLWFGSSTSGSRNDQLNEPCHLAVSISGHILVADRVNRRIRLLDCRLKSSVMDLIEDLDHSPNRIHLDDATGRLYVGHKNGNVVVYRIIA